jgi:aminopeptidase N
MRLLPRTVSTSAVCLLAIVGGFSACKTASLVPPPRMVVPTLMEHSAPELLVDVEDYSIDLVLDPMARAIQGSCKVRFTAGKGELSQLVLSLEGLRAHRVTDIAGRELAFFQKGGDLTIILLESIDRGAVGEVTVDYGGTPQKGLWFVRERDGVPTQVFTQGECEDSQWWFPCNDVPSDRATSQVRVTMPAGWTSTAAGELIDHQVGAGAVVDTWRMSVPHPAYLTTLVAGEFTTVTDEWEGVPLTYMAAPEYATYLKTALSETPAVLDFMSDITGLRYPYAKYSQACVDGFPFGGMENISATTLTSTTLRDARGLRDGDAVGLIAHEAAHQWFGDLLTCNSWDHIWLNESFATYMTLLYFESSRGDEEFRMRWFDQMQRYLASDVGEKRRPTVHNVYRDPIDLFFGGQTYGGGSVRLHYLRFMLGDDTFFEGIRTYVAENQGRGVTTDDLQLAMEKAAGRDLDTFFQQWLHSEGFPELSVSWDYDAEKGMVDMYVEQNQSTRGGTTGVFVLPVDVEVRSPKGSVIHRIEITERRQHFQMAADEMPSWVWFDEGGWVPAEVDRTKKLSEWLAIAARQDDVVARRIAIDVLGNQMAAGTAGSQLDFVHAELVNRLRQDSSSWVRKSAAIALGKGRTEEARLRLMTAASSDESSHVRRAALGALGAWGQNFELATFARTTYDAAYSWGTMASAAELLAKSDPESIFPWLVRELFDADSPHDVLRADLLHLMATLDSTRVTSQLTQWATDTSAHTASRAAAVAGLADRGQLDQRARKALIGMLKEEDFRLRGAVVKSLTEFKDGASRKALQTFYSESVFPREKRAIEAAFGK